MTHILHLTLNAVSTSGGDILDAVAAVSRQVPLDAAAAPVVVPAFAAPAVAAATVAPVSDVAVVGRNVILYQPASNLLMITVTVQLVQGTEVLPGRYCETFLDPGITIEEVLKKFSTSFSMKHHLCCIEDPIYGQLNKTSILANVPTEHPEEKNGHRKLTLLNIRVPLLVSLSLQLVTTSATASSGAGVTVVAKQKFNSTKKFFSAISAALNIDICNLKQGYTVRETSNQSCMTEYSWSNPALQGSIGDIVELIYGAHTDSDMMLKEYELIFSITAVVEDS